MRRYNFRRCEKRSREKEREMQAFFGCHYRFVLVETSDMLFMLFIYADNISHKQNASLHCDLCLLCLRISAVSGKAATADTDAVTHHSLQKLHTNTFIFAFCYSTINILQNNRIKQAKKLFL